MGKSAAFFSAISSRKAAGRNAFGREIETQETCKFIGPGGDSDSQGDFVAVPERDVIHSVRHG